MSKITLNELLSKTGDQLCKEATRRGIDTNFISRNDLIQRILEHDAYYNGVNDARKNCVKNGKPGVVVAVAQVMSEPERELYCFVNGEEPYDEPWLMMLTPEQAKFVGVLKDQGIIYDAIEVNKIPRDQIVTP